MMLFYRVPEYIKRERELCDRIREVSEEVDRLGKEGQDTTETLRRLEAVLETFRSFRREFEGKG